MPRIKVYECCICHEILEDEKPIRLTKQKYGVNGYKQYGYVNKYDFCRKCYGKFHNWIKKHRENK